MLEQQVARAVVHDARHAHAGERERLEPARLVVDAGGGFRQQQRSHRQRLSGDAPGQPAHEERLRQPPRALRDALGDVALAAVFEQHGALGGGAQRGIGGGDERFVGSVGHADRRESARGRRGDGPRQRALSAAACRGSFVAARRVTIASNRRDSFAAMQRRRPRSGGPGTTQPSQHPPWPLRNTAGSRSPIARHSIAPAHRRLHAAAAAARGHRAAAAAGGVLLELEPASRLVVFRPPAAGDLQHRADHGRSSARRCSASRLAAVLWSLGWNLLWARLILDMYADRRLAFWTLAALNLTVVYEAFGVGPTPDAPLLFAWTGAIWAVWRLEPERRRPLVVRSRRLRRPVVARQVFGRPAAARRVRLPADVAAAAPLAG